MSGRRRQYSVTRPFRVVTLLATVLLVSGCGAAKSPPGTVIDGLGQGIDGDIKKITIPTGVVSVTFGAPRTHLTKMEVGDSSDHTADSGTEYVPVHTSFLLTVRGDDMSQFEPAKVRLVAARKDTAIDAPYKIGFNFITPHLNTVFVVVDKGHPVRVEVTYGGKTQGVSSSG